jgi:hypothetical protein
MGVIVGPVLGFRGCKGNMWHTSALVVVSQDFTTPRLTWTVEGEGSGGELEAVLLKDFGRRGVWRFDWKVPQKDNEGLRVRYALTGDETYTYHVPAKGRPPHIAYASCAGFHSLKDMKRVEKKNAMWEVLAEQHRRKPFHLLLMGGDQVYADLIWDEVPALRDWLDKPLEKRLKAPFTEKMRAGTERFYFDLYCARWSQPEPKQVMSQVPTMMMWDDHDIFDGYGSYPEEQQNCPVYRGVYEQAREHFSLFQLQLDEKDSPPEKLLAESEVPSKNLSYAHCIGDVALAVLDMRSERTQGQVMSLEAWDALEDWMNKEAKDCEHLLKHLLIISSIPVVYINSNMLETALGLFPGQQDFEDDLRDQWMSRTHKIERLRLIHRLLRFSQDKKCRVTIVSGDVHVAALGHISSQRDGGLAQNEVNAINQLVSSAMVNVPPSETVTYLMERVAGGEVEEIDRDITAELQNFPGTNRRLIGARNWLSLTFDEKHNIWAEWYVEGKEVPYTKVVHSLEALTY